MAGELKTDGKNKVPCFWLQRLKRDLEVGNLKIVIVVTSNRKIRISRMVIFRDPSVVNGEINIYSYQIIVLIKENDEIY